MTMTTGRFEMPKNLVKEPSSATNTYGKFVAEPFESGYALTVGNAIRRVLLSSIEGAAICAVKIEGAHHEFCSIPGMVEDVTDVILNVKKLLVKIYSREEKTMRIKVKGPREVTAGDIECDGSIEILNPSLYLATLAQDGKFEAEFTAVTGRGFMAADTQESPRAVDVIPLDCAFSPVRKVNFTVENTRVGRKTDYEKLILEITTDERITPDESIVRAAAILRHHLDVFVNYSESAASFAQESSASDRNRDDLMRKLNMSVNEIELSVRAANCLNNSNILYVGELAQAQETDLLKHKNFGRKSLMEIKRKLEELGLSLGMGIDKTIWSAPPRPTEKAK